MEIFTEIRTKGVDVHKFGSIGDPTKLAAEVQAFLNANPGFYQTDGYCERREGREMTYTECLAGLHGGPELTYCAEVARRE